jgi:hypothetical protein
MACGIRSDCGSRRTAASQQMTRWAGRRSRPKSRNGIRLPRTNRRTRRVAARGNCPDLRKLAKVIPTPSPARRDRNSVCLAPAPQRSRPPDRFASSPISSTGLAVHNIGTSGEPNNALINLVELDPRSFDYRAPLGALAAHIGSECISIHHGGFGP